MNRYAEFNAEDNDYKEALKEALMDRDIPAKKGTTVLEHCIKNRLKNF